MTQDERLQLQLDFIQLPARDFRKKYTEVVIEGGKITSAEVKQLSNIK